MSSDDCLANHEIAMRSYYRALDGDDHDADELLALANACYAEYDRALQREFETGIDASAPLSFHTAY